MTELNKCPYCGHNAKIKGNMAGCDWLFCKVRPAAEAFDGENVSEKWNEFTEAVLRLMELNGREVIVMASIDAMKKRR